MPRIIKSAKGTFTTSTVTIDSSGRVISAATGASGGANLVPKQIVLSQSPGTYTANTSNANYAVAYIFGGGGGGGGAGNHPGPQAGAGGPGGDGGFGVFGFPVSSGDSHNYTIGGGGSAGNSGPTQPGNAGQAGQATTLTNIGTANAGNGGGGGVIQGGPGNTGNQGAAPGALFSQTSENVKKLYTGNNDFGKKGGSQQSGNAGGLLIYENIGV